MVRVAGLFPVSALLPVCGLPVFPFSVVSQVSASAPDLSPNQKKK